jgi:hypothetical protein
MWEWLGTVLVDAQDRQINGETGYEETGASAKPREPAKRVSR